MDDRPILDGTLITLSFWEKTFEGTAGCNHYRGEYTAGEGKFKIYFISITVMLCSQPAIMDQENRYMDSLKATAIKQAAAYRIVKDRTGSALELLDANGQAVFIYRPALKDP